MVLVDWLDSSCARMGSSRIKIEMPGKRKSQTS